MQKKEPFVLENNYFYAMSQFSINDYQVGFWDVDETITELAYLTHSYFRYYGKFPSKIAKLIIDDLLSRNLINPNEDYILDNYSGSGTTLVEAKLYGFNSAGIDINPLAVLASNVKTKNYDTVALSETWLQVEEKITRIRDKFINNNTPSLLFTYEVTEDDIVAIENGVSSFMDKYKDAGKWFTLNTIRDLTILKKQVLSIEDVTNREFFELAFLAIIRRVSTAYDGEVRPHVNKRKKEKDVFKSFGKKIQEMIELMKDWNNEVNHNVSSSASIISNSNRNEIEDFLHHLNYNQQLGLVISHPPYLNCFDYFPVFKLEFMWGEDMPDVFNGYLLSDLRKEEIKSYPVSDDKSIQKYFEKQIETNKIVFDNLRPGGYCCIVVGDCTVKGSLFPVHKTFIKIMEDIGFETEKIEYRSTSYGIGQYAYSFRADYNEHEGRKQDGVIFFKKPME